MTLAQVRKYALSLTGVSEEPHHERTSFRVAGKIFATAKPQESHIHVFVPESIREPAVAMHPEFVSKLTWRDKVVGLRIELEEAKPAVVKDLVEGAWRSKAPRK
jgi:hypothetical protein